MHSSYTPAPWNQTHESVPMYKCSTPECVNYARDEDDHHQCNFCGSRFCADCLVRIEDLKACPACRVCALCGDEAIAQCAMCSDLVCALHVRSYSDADHSTGYHESGDACAPRCKPVVITPAQVVELEELEHAPF